MNNIEYEKELEKTLSDFFEKHRKIIENMTQEEEREYVRKNKLNDEIEQIYKKLREKYKIK